MTNQCTIHLNLFDVAKDFERLTIEDQKLILEFVDAFHPPNHLLYFLMKEIYSTQVNRMKTTAKNDRSRLILEIESVRDYELIKTENAFTRSDMDGYSTRRGKNLTYTANRYTGGHDDDIEDDIYVIDDDDDDDADDDFDVNEGRSKKRCKIIGARGGKTQTRKIYKLMHSNAANNIEERYRTLLNEEGYYYDTKLCRVMYRTITERGNKEKPLHVIHETRNLKCNAISGYVRDTMNEWITLQGSSFRDSIGFAVRLNEKATENGEFSEENYDAYDVCVKIRMDESRMIFVKSAIQKMFEFLTKRKREVNEYYEKFQKRYHYSDEDNDDDDDDDYDDDDENDSYKDDYHDKNRKNVDGKHDKTYTLNGKNRRGKEHGRKLRYEESSDDENNYKVTGRNGIRRKTTRDRDEYKDKVKIRKQRKRKREKNYDDDADTIARKRGHSLKMRGRDSNFKLKKYHTLVELESVLSYVCELSSLKVIKLIDFAILTARDAWHLINSVMDKALEVYTLKKRYPIRESLTGIIFYDRENVEELIGAESERIFHLDRYHIIWQHGLTSKLGNIAAFVVSFRRFMQIVVLCCCYFMTRKSLNTRGTVAKHKCTFPAASQGIYYNLFLRMQKGHDLLCKMKVESKADALTWLKTFDQLRSSLWIKREIPYSRKLSKHLSKRNVEYLHERNTEMSQIRGNGNISSTFGKRGYNDEADSLYGEKQKYGDAKRENEYINDNDDEDDNDGVDDDNDDDDEDDENIENNDQKNGRYIENEDYDDDDDEEDEYDNDKNVDDENSEEDDRIKTHGTIKY